MITLTSRPHPRPHPHPHPRPHPHPSPPTQAASTDAAREREGLLALQRELEAKLEASASELAAQSSALSSALASASEAWDKTKALEKSVEGSVWDHALDKIASFAQGADLPLPSRKEPTSPTSATPPATLAKQHAPPATSAASPLAPAPLQVDLRAVVGTPGRTLAPVPWTLGTPGPPTSGRWRKPRTVEGVGLRPQGKASIASPTRLKSQKARAGSRGQGGPGSRAQGSGSAAASPGHARRRRDVEALYYPIAAADEPSAEQVRLTQALMAEAFAHRYV